MYRFNKKKLIALCLSFILLAGCTVSGDVDNPTQTTDNQGIVRIPYREMISGDKYDYSYGKAVTEGSFPSYYNSTSVFYDSFLYTDLPETEHEVDVYLPFGENRDTPYIVADEEVSARIVERLTTQARALVGTGCPDMRGKAVYDAMTLENEWIDVYPYEVINNVVSFEISRRLRYREDGEESARYVFSATYLTFDLNTGDLVPLSALFTDGYDYKTRLNDAIEKYIAENAGEPMEYMGGFTMLRPFAGIRDDQPYHLTSSHLLLVMDMGNPEFSLADSQLVIGIPLYELADCLAIFDRYNTDESIYADSRTYIATTIANSGNSSSTVVDFSEPDKYYYSVLNFGAPSLPESVDTAFENYKKNMVLSVSNYKIMADADIEYSDIDSQRSYNADITSNIVGDYGVLTIGDYYSGFAQREDRYTQNTFCFNIKENRPAAIGDYFVKGFDYVAMLDEYFHSQEYLSEMYEYIDSVSVLVDENPQSELKPTPNDIICLVPNQRGFSFTVKLSEDGILGEMYGDWYSLTGFIQYEEIGYENLTLFS